MGRARPVVDDPGRVRLVAAPWHVAASLVAGVALAALPRAAGPAALIVGGVAGALMGVWTARARPAPGSVSGDRALAERVEQVAPWLTLVFFIPLVTLPVPPGADMAMHVALARALAAGASEVSPAWPGVAPPVYPRGFSGLVALVGPLGFARAGLLVSGLAYVLYTAGTVAVLAGAGVRSPWTLAVLTVLLAKVPQEMFAWGGTPTVLALALGLHAAAALRAPGAPGLPPALGAALLLAGAAAVHPMGALAGALVTVVHGRGHRRVAAWVGLGGLGLVLALLATSGPALSAAEIDWAVRWGQAREALLHDAPWQFAWRIWPALWHALGPVWMLAVGGAALVLLGRGQRGVVGRGLVLVLTLGALLALLRVIPSAVGVVYPGRLAPVFALAMAPLLGAALAGLPGRLRGIAALLLLAAALPLHLRWYQGAGPMATRADIRLLECVARRTVGDAVIAGAYGDATQRVPALTGRRITLPHRHVSVLDETAPGLALLRPTHRLGGERTRYAPAFPGPEPPPEPSGAPLCQEGAARLWALP